MVVISPLYIYISHAWWLNHVKSLFLLVKSYDFPHSWANLLPRRPGICPIPAGPPCYPATLPAVDRSHGGWDCWEPSSWRTRSLVLLSIWQNPWGETYGTWAEAWRKRFSATNRLAKEKMNTNGYEGTSFNRTDRLPIFVLYSNVDPSLEVQTLDAHIVAV